MFVIIGAIIVLASVIGGYLMEHGNLSVLFQPSELIIIGGASIGALVIASPLTVIKNIIKSIIKALTAPTILKDNYHLL